MPVMKRQGGSVDSSAACSTSASTRLGSLRSICSLAIRLDHLIQHFHKRIDGYRRAADADGLRNSVDLDLDVVGVIDDELAVHVECHFVRMAFACCCLS